MAKPEAGKEATVLSTRSGETAIQVTESEEGGTKIIRVKTTFQGKESVVSLAVDEPAYEVEIPLSFQQAAPQGAGQAGGGGGGAGGGNDFQELLMAQYLEKAQAAMLEGNYNEALRQVNLVLLVRPQHIKANEMKGSIYYAMGNYQLANETWEQVLALDPSNQEVREFMEFNQKTKGAERPPLPQALQQPVSPPEASPATPPPGAQASPAEQAPAGSEPAPAGQGGAQ